MYWIASWSPSQSAPLMVSYACHLQSSSVMFPSAALIPPCAATVCERVGNNFVMHAVFRPCSDIPIAARRPAPPAPTTTASYSWSMIVYAAVPVETVGENGQSARASPRTRPRGARSRRGSGETEET